MPDHAAFALHMHNPPFEHFHHRHVSIERIKTNIGILMIKIMANIEILSKTRNSAYFPSILRHLAAQFRIAAMVGMVMAQDEIIYRTLRNQPLHVATHPFAAEPFG